MASLSTSGIGSGIDIPALVDNLINAERTPVTNRLDRQEADLQAKVSAYGTLKSALSTFQDSLSELKFSSTFNDVSITSSNEDAVTASGSSIAQPNNYSVEISNLAQAHSLSSKSFAETTDPVGTGSLTFEFGHFDGSFINNPDKASKTVNIDPEDNSLQGIRDAVNNADIGVTASLVNDGTGFKLLFSSDETGLENGLKISVNDLSDASNTDDSGLSQLAFDPDPAAAANSHLTENQAALDASFTLNGLNISSASNTVSSAVTGVTFTLKGTTDVGSPATINIARDDAKVTDAVTGFTEKYNELVDTLTLLRNFDTETNEAGPLLSDSALRGVESQLRRILSSSVTDTDGNLSSLSTIGITTDRTGKLALDNDKLQANITDNRDLLAQIFSAHGTASDSQINFISSSANTKTGNYAINLNTTISRGVFDGNTFHLPENINKTPNLDLNIRVDGIDSGAINITQNNYATGTELATELQTQINASSSLKDAGASVIVSFTDGALHINSSSFGSSSTVEITSIDTSKFDVGLLAGVGVSGTDVSGTIGGFTATGSGSVLTGQTGDAEGMVLEFTGGDIGNRGTVSFNRGVADQLDSLLTQLLDTNSILDTRTESLNNQIGRINEQRTELDNRLAGLEGRLFAQFNAMDAIVAQLQSTGTFLEQQLSALPGVTRDNN